MKYIMDEIADSIWKLEQKQWNRNVFFFKYQPYLPFSNDKLYYYIISEMGNWDNKMSVVSYLLRTVTV